MELVWKRHWFWKRFMPVTYIDNSPEKPWNKTASNFYMYVTFKHHLTCFWVANGVQFELGKIQTKSYDYLKVVKARWCAYLCLWFTSTTFIFKEVLNKWEFMSSSISDVVGNMCP
jgi:hypothetical protein